MIDEQGTLVQFRMLGKGLGAEIGAAVAIELDGELFAPIHDHNGNVVGLVNADTGKPAETYRYTAFGEEVCSKKPIYDENVRNSFLIGNPWGFASKRRDAETALIHFGRRYFDPKTGRWTTPDPLGYAEGPNLYAYVRNSPLIHYDLWGLARIRESERTKTDSNRSRSFSPWLGLLGSKLVSQENRDKIDQKVEAVIARSAHDLFSVVSGMHAEIRSSMDQLENAKRSLGLDTHTERQEGYDTAGVQEQVDARGHELIDKVFSTNLAGLYTPEALAMQAEYGPVLGMLPAPTMTVASGISGWRVGQPVTILPGPENSPSWSTVRARY